MGCFITAESLPERPHDGTTTTGAGGSGGTCADPAVDCGGSALPCTKWTCDSGECVLAIVPDGTACGSGRSLVCEGGECKCSDATECSDLACLGKDCLGGACVYFADGSLSCGSDGMGSCSEGGECGLCDDGAQNGDETGVDCGGGTPCGACPGEACLGGECASGFCVDGVCCDEACDGMCVSCAGTLTGEMVGVCLPIGVGQGDPQFPGCDSMGGCGEAPGWCACEDGIQNGDETDVDCGGVCGPTCTIAQGCELSTDCGVGLCVDGVCCDAPCTGVCDGCALPGKEGICSPAAGPDLSGCDGATVCNFSGSCLAALGEPCSGSGMCGSGLCDGGVCAACGLTSPCAGGKICAAGYCVAGGLVTGDLCVAAAQCSSGACVDGVCCSSTCDEPCRACNAAYTGQITGNCYFIAAGFDPDGECGGPGLAGVCNGRGECGQN